MGQEWPKQWQQAEQHQQSQPQMQTNQQPESATPHADPNAFPIASAASEFFSYLHQTLTRSFFPKLNMVYPNDWLNRWQLSAFKHVCKRGSFNSFLTAETSTWNLESVASMYFAKTAQWIIVFPGASWTSSQIMTELWNNEIHKNQNKQIGAKRGQPATGCPWFSGTIGSLGQILQWMRAKQLRQINTQNPTKKPTKQKNTKSSMCTRTRWSPRTRMPTRMLRNTDLRPTCHNFQRTHLWNTLTWHTEAKIL